jgi:hypothetical protein
MFRSTVFVSGSNLPSSMNIVNPAQCVSVYSMASCRVEIFDSPAFTATIRACSASMIGFVSACRTARRLAAVVPRISFSIA